MPRKPEGGGGSLFVVARAGRSAEKFKIMLRDILEEANIIFVLNDC